MTNANQLEIKESATAKTEQHAGDHLDRSSYYEHISRLSSNTAKADPIKDGALHFSNPYEHTSHHHTHSHVVSAEHLARDAQKLGKELESNKNAQHDIARFGKELHDTLLNAYQHGGTQEMWALQNKTDAILKQNGGEKAAQVYAEYKNGEVTPGFAVGSQTHRHEVAFAHQNIKVGG